MQGLCPPDAFSVLAAPMSSFSSRFQRPSLKRFWLLGYKKHLVALLHSFVVNVRSLFTLEILAKMMERNHVLVLAAALDMGRVWVHEINNARKQLGESNQLMQEFRHKFCSLLDYDWLVREK